MALSREKLYAFADCNKDIGPEESVLHSDCSCLEFLLDNCEITVPAENRFFVHVNCEGVQLDIYRKREREYAEAVTELGFRDGNEALAYTGDSDFGHTSAEWESVIRLGIFGLRERIRQYRRSCPGDEKKQRFYGELLRVYDAALRFMKRAAIAARDGGKAEMAESLARLSECSPSDLYGAMQTSLLYYHLQQFFEGTILRTMGRLDSLFYPYFLKESSEKREALVYDYIKELNRLKVGSNLPFAIGGTDVDGSSLVNALSYVLLESYRKQKPSDIKLHLLCADNTPDGIIRKAFEAIRSGCNSIVFLSDKTIIQALEKLGETRADATDYHIVGCYECGGNNEVTCSCNARVNLPKALELTLNNGVDMLSGKRIGCETGESFRDYDSFYASVEKQLAFLCTCAMRETDLKEENYRKIHAAPFLSGTYTSALEKGGDIYCDYAAAYNNSSLNALGIATLVDSLYTIKKLVFEDKRISLERLAEILKSNWENEELLRLRIQNTLPKYGMGNKEVDRIAGKVAETLSAIVNRRKNAKGGVYRLGLFSIDWRWAFGEKTAASADGRRRGEPLSQNMSASFGADKNGVTGHFLSACAVDASNAVNGAIVDIDLHASAAAGEDGLNALTASLKTYFKLGGACVQSAAPACSITSSMPKP